MMVDGGGVVGHAGGPGLVEVWSINNANQWVRKGRPLAGDGIESEFGSALSMSADGNHLVVGARWAPEFAAGGNPAPPPQGHRYYKLSHLATNSHMPMTSSLMFDVPGEGLVRGAASLPSGTNGGAAEQSDACNDRGFFLWSSPGFAVWDMGTAKSVTRIRFYSSYPGGVRDATLRLEGGASSTGPWTSVIASFRFNTSGCGEQFFNVDAGKTGLLKAYSFVGGAWRQKGSTIGGESGWHDDVQARTPCSSRSLVYGHGQSCGALNSTRVHALCSFFPVSPRVTFGRARGGGGQRERSPCP